MGPTHSRLQEHGRNYRVVYVMLISDFKNMEPLEERKEEKNGKKRDQKCGLGPHVKALNAGVRGMVFVLLNASFSHVIYYTQHKYL